MSRTMASSDHFDRLPDAVILLILNSIHDVKVLGSCAAVSKRFQHLVPLVDDIVVRVDCILDEDEPLYNILEETSTSLISRVMRFMSSLGRTLQGAMQLLTRSESMARASPLDIAHHSPCEVLRNFTEVQTLRIELPGAELGVNEGALLRWHAQFGSTLESCVILGATAFERHAPVNKADQESPHSGSDRHEGTLCTSEEWGGASSSPLQQVAEAIDVDKHVAYEPTGTNNLELTSCDADHSDTFTCTDLKVRIIWTISSLIAAAARHYLLQQIIAEHPTLQSLVLADAEGQGTLVMNRTQLKAFGSRTQEPSSSCSRTRLPDLKMSLRYASELTVNGGVLRGATLIDIKQKVDFETETAEKLGRHPVEGNHWTSGKLEEPLKEAVHLLAKRRTHFLEMNSF